MTKIISFADTQMVKLKKIINDSKTKTKKNT